MKNRVVVTGIGIVSPLGLDRQSTWHNLIAGKSGVAPITSFDTEGYRTTIAAEVKGFDAAAFVGRKEARRMDRFVQLGAVAALEAVEHAGLKVTSDNCTRVSIMIASGIGGIITLSEQVGVLGSRGPSRVSPFLVPMNAPRHGVWASVDYARAKGPNYSTVSACSSGADSIGQALEVLQEGDADVVLAGGAEAAICPIGVAGFNACQALSTRNDDPKGASRPFDAERDGFVIGEGAAVIVMETLQSAVKRGATPLVEIVGYGSTADANHITQPAPEGEGASRAMKIAIKKAGLQPDEIGYVNAHGTSTPLNDKYETMAMKGVFDEEVYRVPISSTKSMTGHLLGASGALEAAITTLAISEETIPPTINLKNADPECDLDYTPHIARQGAYQCCAQ